MVPASAALQLQQLGHLARIAGLFAGKNGRLAEGLSPRCRASARTPMRVAIISSDARRQWFIGRSSWPLYYYTANVDKA